MDPDFSFAWATIILAAGSSSRMGQPKQLISMGGETLVQRTIRTAAQAGSNKTVVVFGANHEKIRDSLQSDHVELVYNQHWQRGMGGSLKCGLNFVMSKFSEVEVALFLVCDQPLLTTEHLKKMLEKFSETNSPIVASYYAGKNGVPVLFHKSLFHELRTIDDQYGAKRVIEQNSALVKSVDFPNGVIDLDTPEDWQKYKGGNIGFR